MITWNKSVLTILLLFIGISMSAQDSPNGYDNQGLRHGKWQSFYENDPSQIKFEGTFEHGKEKGLFKFYDLGLEHPVATILFDPASDTVQVKYLSQNGQTISEGKMLNKKRIGTWKYYHKGSDKVMSMEEYEDDLLNGEKITFYNSGAVAEKANYKDGKLQGERFLYSEKGVVLEQLNYKNGELHGPAKFFNGKGELLSEGEYRNDKHYGIWNYYENGKLKERKDFSSK